jgi:hypothetical protein
LALHDLKVDIGGIARSIYFIGYIRGYNWRDYAPRISPDLHQDASLEEVAPFRHFLDILTLFLYPGS